MMNGEDADKSLGQASPSGKGYEDTHMRSSAHGQCYEKGDD